MLETVLGRASSGYGFLAFSDMPYSFSFIFGFRIYSDMVAQQDLAFKMTHIEAKSINIWLRHLGSILGHRQAWKLQCEG